MHEGRQGPSGESGRHHTALHQIHCCACPLLSLLLLTVPSCHLLAVPCHPIAIQTQQGARRMSFPQFLGCLPRLAEARGCTEAEVVRRLVACEGPTRHGTTTPEAVRLSDRSNFSGAHAAVVG